MSRGDQRERDRAKNLKKQQDKQKGAKKDGTVESRNLNDKERLLAKVG